MVHSIFHVQSQSQLSGSRDNGGERICSMGTLLLRLTLSRLRTGIPTGKRETQDSNCSVANGRLDDALRCYSGPSPSSRPGNDKRLVPVRALLSPRFDRPRFPQLTLGLLKDSTLNFRKLLLDDLGGKQGSFGKFLFNCIIFPATLEKVPIA